MTKLIMLLTLLATAWVQDIENAILVISGADSMEELSDDEVERFRKLALHPLDINGASRSRLLASGLFSEEQAASITEYRLDSGDILSITELSLINGFNASYAKALTPFISLRSDRAPGQREDRRLRHELMLRGAARQVQPGTASAKSGTAHAWGLKYGLEWGEKGELHWASRTTYDKGKLSAGTISAAFYGRRWLGKVVAGDFAARFGQGLCAWTGFSLSNLMTIQSYKRNGSGLSPSSSFASTEKGIGADFNFGRWTLSTAQSFSSGNSYFNINRCGRAMSFGITATNNAAGADFKFSLPSLSIFGEGGWNGKPMGVAGIIWSPEYGQRYGGMAKYTGGIFQAAAGAENGHFRANFESKLNYTKRTEQYRLQLSAAKDFALGGFTISPSLRLSGKYKAPQSVPWRGDARAEISAIGELWRFNARFDAVLGRAFASAGHIEAGLKNDSFTLWLRAGLFAIDNWDDRIYVYERDVPGSFNVPAYYGRGWNASVVASVKKGRHSIHMRLATINYFNEKPDRLEFRLQYSLRLGGYKTGSTASIRMPREPLISTTAPLT